MRHFLNTRKTALAASILVANAALLAPKPGFAQGADGADLEEVVVTGFRSSLERALEVKRNENGVVDAIVAEDIADFPDLNLAESIQRIPGVSINRVNGEGRQVTVRGLQGKFNRILINGMEAMSTTGGTDSSGGSNRDRAFDFNTFASELFNQITVRKTQSASVEEGSLGATVELRTARPFDYDEGTTMAFSVQGGYNDLASKTNPRVAGVYAINNGDFGALVSVAYSDRNFYEEGFSTVRWQDGTFNSVGGVDCGDNPTSQGCVDTDTNSLNYHPRIPRYGRLSHDQQRLGITGSLQFNFSDSTSLSVDALYSKFEADRDEEFLEVFLRSQEKYIDVDSYTLDAATNTVSSATMDIPQLANGTHPIRSEHRFDEQTTDFFQLTVELDHDFSDRLRGRVLAGTAESEYDVPRQTTIIADAIGTVEGFSYDFTSNKNMAALDFGSLDVTDPSQWAFTEVRDRPQSVENSFSNIQASLEYDLTEDMLLSGGVSFKKYEFETTGVRRESTFGSIVCGLPGDYCEEGATGLPLTGDLLSYVTGFSTSGPAGNPNSWVSTNVDAAVAAINLNDIPGTIRAGDNRAVEEEDTGVWAQLSFTADIGVPIRGDVGIRWVETETTATGIVATSPEILAATVTRSYTDTLPSLNLAIDLTDDVVVRFGAAKVMSRPNLGNLTPGGSLDSFSGEPYGYSRGNPGLDPFRATTYDLGVEWYFAEESLLSVTYFRKDVDSFFQTSETVEVPYSQTGLADNLPPASSPLYNDLAAGLDPLVELKQTLNGGDAELDGWEIIYQQPFTMLPAPFNKFGFTGNFTKVDSDKILGFSPTQYNATLYYEADRWSARISTAYREAYQTRAANSRGRDERGYADNTRVDFASRYDINDNLSLTFEVINITDEYELQVFDQADLVNVYHRFGREFLLGVRYDM